MSSSCPEKFDKCQQTSLVAAHRFYLRQKRIYSTHTFNIDSLQNGYLQGPISLGTSCRLLAIWRRSAKRMSNEIACTNDHLMSGCVSKTTEMVQEASYLLRCFVNDVANGFVDFLDKEPSAQMAKQLLSLDREFKHLQRR